MYTLSSLGTNARRARARGGWRILTVAALVVGLLVTVLPSPVAAAAPTVAANPALVPFDTTPGKPGTTTVTFTANGTTGLTACGQDNANLPTFPLGAVDPNTPLVVPFPFIQAGKYTFWVSADSTCAGAKFAVGGVPVQATATRLGPTGLAGMDDVEWRQGTGVLKAVPGRFPGPPSNITNEDVLINGRGITGQQKFPIPNVQLCFMSGDGSQVDISMRIGQDARLAGGVAATTTVLPVAGQNGCFDIPWLVNGGYTATINRAGAPSAFATYGFCINATDAGENLASEPVKGIIGICAQVAFNIKPSDSPFPNGTNLLGSIVTGADNHAVQVCVSAFTPSGNGAVPPIATLPNSPNAYNQSGAVNLTRLTLEFPPKTFVKVQTFDITGPGPGGQGGLQFTCPTATATQSSGGTAIFAISTTAPAGTTIIDTKFYSVM